MAVNWDDTPTGDGYDVSKVSDQDLSWAYDDPEEPTTITVYSDAEPEVHTQWISIVVQFAIKLEKCR